MRRCRWRIAPPQIVLVTFAHNDNHFNIDDHESNELPNFTRTEKTCCFSRNHRGMKFIIFCEIKLFRFYCHYYLLIRVFSIKGDCPLEFEYLFRNYFPERFEFCFIDKQIMQDMFDPVTSKSNFSESIIGITTRSWIFFMIRHNRINGHSSSLSI